MFTDPAIWAWIYRLDRVAEAQAEAMRKAAEQGRERETLWFQAGAWMIRFGRWMQER